jgi:menaquinone-dependent protoporphyrinogen oxidase
MARILIVYGSFDGQARRIAERIAAVFTADGHKVSVRDADFPMAAGDISDHDAVVIGGGVRIGRFPRSLGRAVHGRAAAIEGRPNAFFSVCMAARDPVRGEETARGYAGKFLAACGWKPRLTAAFAGALRYTRYNPFVRMLMKAISKSAGGDTDTSRDFEYTDWAAVERFAREFEALLPKPAVAPSARHQAFHQPA